jgi:hypothetical protein
LEEWGENNGELGDNHLDSDKCFLKELESSSEDMAAGVLILVNDVASKFEVEHAVNSISVCNGRMFPGDEGGLVKGIAGDEFVEVSVGNAASTADAASGSAASIRCSSICDPEGCTLVLEPKIHTSKN